MSIVIARDATHSNIGHLPPGQSAGYTTGSGGIAWTAADWAAHPGAVRIDQDAAASDGTADVLDVEGGAATYADCAGWVTRAYASYAAAKRPGQRKPAIYASASSITSVVNALVHGGRKSGAGLWVANWNLNEAAAAALVAAAFGPFPVIGIQFTDAAGFYDTDVFSAAWLADVSGPPHPPVLPMIGEGALGNMVRLLQADLNLRAARITVDGVFGPKTLAAVKAFQKAHPPLTVDGICGPNTWAALGK
jgi:hypothetical protein